MAKHMASNKRQRYESKRKLQKKAKTRFVLFIILILLFVYSTFQVGYWVYSNINLSKQDEKIKEETKVVKEDEKGQKVETVDFSKLKEINQDVVGWIKIANTNINYPILQTNDNEYYLKRDIYKQYSSCGSVFMDYRNNKEFEDKNTVIFGHNLTLGKMFSDLQKIPKGELGNEIYVDIDIENKQKQYKVFSSYKTEPLEDPITINIKDSKEFIDKALKNSQINFQTQPNEQDSIITLSTCDNTGKKRIIVHAVEILEENLQ